MSSVIRGAPLKPDSATSASARRQDTWSRKERDLRSSFQWPLRGVRKFTINPSLNDDLQRFPSNFLRNHPHRWFSAPFAAAWATLYRLPYAFLLLTTLLECLNATREVSNGAMSHDTRVFMFVLPVLISTLCAMYEDWRLYGLGAHVNERPCVIVDGRNPQFLTVPRKDLRVGQIVRVHDHEEVPADCLLLSTSSDDASAFVSQELLTGNENLVRKVAVQETRYEIAVSSVSSISGQVVCNQPTADWSHFYGGLRLEAHPRGTSLDSNSFMCQGSILRGTDWLYCLILFTGPDTKLAKARDSVKYLSPSSKYFFERTINGLTAFLCIVSFGLSLIYTLLAFTRKYIYLDPTNSQRLIFIGHPQSNPLVVTCEFFVLFSSIVSPVLLVVADIIALINATVTERRLRHAAGYRHPLTSTKKRNDSKDISFRVSRSAALRNLGTVDYLLTDKTGTLTVPGPLKFTVCSIGRRVYGTKNGHRRPPPSRGSLRHVLKRLEPDGQSEAPKPCFRTDKSVRATFPYEEYMTDDDDQEATSEATTVLIERMNKSNALEASFLPSLQASNHPRPSSDEWSDITTPHPRKSTSKVSLNRSFYLNQTQGLYNYLNCSRALQQRRLHTISALQPPSPTAIRSPRCGGRSPKHFGTSTPLVETRSPSRVLRSSLRGEGTLRSPRVENSPKLCTRFDLGRPDPVSVPEFTHSMSHASVRSNNAEDTSDALSMARRSPKRRRRMAGYSKRPFLLSRQEAKSRRSGFREPGGDEKDVCDFDDISILRDLRRGGVHASQIDEFIKSMLFCSMASSTLSVQPYSSLAASSQMTAPEFPVMFNTPTRKQSEQTVSDTKKFRTNDVPNRISELATDAVLHSINYSSPLKEERTLVRAAFKFGYTMFLKYKRGLILELNGRYERYERVFTMESTDTHKRILAVIQKEGSDDATIYVKGGVSDIFDLITGTDDLSEASSCGTPQTLGDTRHYAANHARRFIMKGYRAIAIAKRHLCRDDLANLTRRLDGIMGCPPQQKEYLYQALSDELESGLEILGIVGLRENLYPGVPKTVNALTQAGVKIWILSGDDLEPTLSTACQAQILRPNMRFLRVEYATQDMSEMKIMHQSFKQECDGKNDLACCITGPDLINFCASSELQLVLLNMLCRCEAVLIAEVSASQKSTIAKLLREKMHPTPCILAVGDGLNDLGMFKEAHVSVAVGSRPAPISPLANFLTDYNGDLRQPVLDARLFADVNIPTFAYLRPLMLEHGRNSIKSAVLWIRSCYVLGIMQVVPLCAYSAMAMWAAIPLWTKIGFSILQFGTLGAMCMIAAARDTEFDSLLLWHLPILYTVVRRQGVFSTTVFIFDCVYASWISFLVTECSRNVLISGFSMLENGGSTESLSMLVFAYIVGIYLSTAVFVVFEASSQNSALFWAIPFVAFCVFLELIMLQSSSEWFYTTYIDGAVNVFTPNKAGIQWLALVLVYFGLSVSTCMLFNMLKDMLTPNVTALVRSFVLQNHQPFISNPLGLQRLSTITKRTQAKTSRVPMEFDLSRRLSGFATPVHYRSTTATSAVSTMPKPVRNRRSQKLTIAFANHCQLIMNPVRAKKLAAIMPKPKRFSLRQKSRNGQIILPLPLVTAIDKVSRRSVQPDSGEIARKDRSRTSQWETEVADHAESRFHHDGKSLEKKYRDTNDQFFFEPESDRRSSTDSLLSGLPNDSPIADNKDSEGMMGSFQEGTMHVSDLINMLQLTFKDQQLEADYQVHRRQHITQYRLSYRVSFLFLCVVTAIMVIQEMFMLQVDVSPAKAVIAFVPYLISLTLYISSHYDVLFINYFDVLLGSLVLAIAFFQLLSDTIMYKDGVTSTAIYSVLIFIFFRIPFLHAVFYNTIHFIAFTIRYALTVTLSDSISSASEDGGVANAGSAGRYYARQLENVSLSKLWTYLPVLLGIEAFTGFAAYRLEYNRRKAFLLDYKVEKTRKRQTEILHTMLPAFVVEHMLNGPFNRNGVPVALKAEDRGTVSVIFCDVYDFQTIVVSVPPTHLVKVLDSLFLCFDRCAERFNCTKIETVFETYLAAAGINLDRDPNLGELSNTPSNNAFDALCTALLMLRFSERITYVISDPSTLASSPSGVLKGSEAGTSFEGRDAAGCSADPLMHAEMSHRTSRSSDGRHKRTKKVRVKIGIHSGRVISGVVGAKKPQYALFGDTVNTASRMKTTGKPGHIHVSSATYNLVKADSCCSWEERQIEVKGKGLMTTYLLFRVDMPQAHPGAPRHQAATAIPTFSPPRESSGGNLLDQESSSDELENERSTETTPRSGNLSPMTLFATQSRGDQLTTDDPDHFDQMRSARVEALWARFNRQPSREGRERRVLDADQESFMSAGDELFTEETVFRTCLRRLRRFRFDRSFTQKDSASATTRRIRAQVHWTSLTFRDKQLEDRYKLHYYTNPSNVNNIEQAIIIFLATYVIQTLVFVAIPRYEQMWVFQSEAAVTWTVRSLFTICSFVLWLLLHFRDRTEISTKIGIKWIVFLANLTFLCSACAVMLESSWSLDYPEDVKPIWLHVDTLQLFFFITILHHNSGLLVQHVVLVNFVVLTIAVSFILTVTQQTDVTFEALFLVPLFVVANVFSVFFKEYVERQSFIINEDMQEMADRGKELLRDMLPREVLEELQQEKLKLAYKHDRITFIFADICGFTSWADTVDASEVVTVLQALFAKFDRDSTHYGVFKVCTIGDAYVAVSEPVTEETMRQGLYDPAVGAERVLAMAQRMIRDIKVVRERLNILSLNMRIGLHFGSCVGGVIGSGRLRYDLWGIDVLTGNLMESNGVPGRICMSQDLVDFLDEKFPGRFHFVFHKKVEVINRTVNAYLLLTERYSFEAAHSGVFNNLMNDQISMHQEHTVTGKTASVAARKFF